MSTGRIAWLARRGVVAVGGDDASAFLDDLVTADVTVAAPGRAVYAALLAPQGKVLFDFIVFRDGARILFDLPRASAADFVKRLTFYRLRARVTIEDVSEAQRVAAAWGDAKPNLDGVAPDPRLAALGWRAIVAAGANIPPEYAAATEADYDAHRIGLGIPEGGIDFAYGETFPHDADIDQLGGIDFAKGCYVGQEVVSRMEHRGSARRRVVIVRGTGPLPATGAAITAGGRPIGTLASSVGEIGLAMVRVDRAKEAMDQGLAVTADGAALTLALPDWARFGWVARPGGEA